MKIKLVVVDLEASRNQKRLALGALLVILAGGSAAVASAVPVNTFATGETLTAAALNANFVDLDKRLVGESTDINALQTENASLKTRITALEAKPPPLTKLDSLLVAPGAASYDACWNQSGPFVQGACDRMASTACQSAGYVNGWFEGDLAPPSYTSIQVYCVK